MLDTFPLQNWNAAAAAFLLGIKSTECRIWSGHLEFCWARELVGRLSACLTSRVDDGRINSIVWCADRPVRCASQWPQTDQSCQRGGLSHRLMWLRFLVRRVDGPTWCLRFSCTGGMQNFCLPAAACASGAPNASNSAKAGSYKFHQLLSRRERRGNKFHSRALIWWQFKVPTFFFVFGKKLTK